MKKTIKIMAVLAPIALVVALMAAVAAVDRISRPPDGEGEAQIVIEPGRNLEQVARTLENEGVIRSSLYFRWIAKRKGYGKNIRAGEYVIPRNLPPEDVLERLVKGRVVYRRFTVPEGKTLAETAAIIEKAGIAGADAFIRAASDTEGMQEWLPPGASNLEGVLFPETYTFTRETTAQDVVKMMTGHFKKVFAPLWTQKKEDVNLKPYEAVILASIIEKETGLEIERPVIAGVFFNRLRLDMRLMSDPTVIYGVPNFNGNLTKKDLATPTPYNTYILKGLPAGPICSPGADSLKAALQPAATPALYFVAKGDGSHHFSNTLEEHNRAVQLYQRKKP